MMMVACVYTTWTELVWNECTQKEKIEPYSVITKCCALDGPDLLSVGSCYAFVIVFFFVLFCFVFSFCDRTELVIWAVLWRRAMM